MNTQSAVREAVTVILAHGDEVFMTRRQNYLSAFPGFYVFPGGTVDAGDLRQANGSSLLDSHEPRLIAALIREIREEIDFDLEHAAQTGLLESINYVGRVKTPASAPRRFDTYFYKVNLRERPDFVVQAQEIASAEWARIDDWLARYDGGQLLLAFPTLVSLRALAENPQCPEINFESLRTAALEPLPGLRIFVVPSNTLPPAAHTNCFLIGDADARRILVDPSPKSADEKQILLEQTGKIGFDEVFLTHHHPDHHQFANDIARELDIPIGASLDTQARIRAKHPGFFDGLTVKTYAEGDTVTRWLGLAVRVVEVPGHDEGQLALMPENRAWFIVGDLIQGIGTVVISAPEGNMRKYFATLERVIGLNPAVIIPSHGSPFGGVHYLQKTLDHRRQREARMLELHGRGYSIEAMLADIYVDLDLRLLPLARRNIESHLDKLREDGAIA